ncbi:MAG: Shedu anti-phage system protein SduA domain-containing protein [Chloroflexota bacterium]
MQKKVDLLRKLAIRVDNESYPVGRTNLLLKKYGKDRQTFKNLIEAKPKEALIQAFLERHPVLLLHAMLDGFYPAASTRSALYSKVALGAEYEVDFAFCNANSMGLWWTFVEIERADVLLFTKAGDPTEKLTHSIRQVLDWQSWMTDHSQYASIELAKLAEDSLTALGFFSSDYERDGSLRRPCNYFIVIGRRATMSSADNRRRIEICTQNPRLQIVTYDRLFDDYDVAKDERLNAGKDQMRNIKELF